MSLLSETVMGLARARRKLSRRDGQEWSDRRLRFIREHVRGRSFADVGGMYGIHGDIAFRAEEAGAAAVTLFDGGDPTPQFLDRYTRQDSAIRYAQGDLEDPLSVQLIGSHDIVWCVGVIYHSPSPVRQLMHLHEITNELLYLGSATIPEIPGFPQASVFYPYLDRRERSPYARGITNAAEAIGIGTAFDARPMYGQANFWWGITPSALRAMLRTARFEVVEELRSDVYPWGTEYVARPLAEHPSLPPVDYFRRRGELREEGRVVPFDGYYDKGPDAIGTIDDAFPRQEGAPEPDPLQPRLRRWRRR